MHMCPADPAGAADVFHLAIRRSAAPAIKTNR